MVLPVEKKSVGGWECIRESSKSDDATRSQGRLAWGLLRLAMASAGGQLVRLGRIVSVNAHDRPSTIPAEIGFCVFRVWLHHLCFLGLLGDDVNCGVFDPFLTFQPVHPHHRRFLNGFANGNVPSSSRSDLNRSLSAIMSGG
jgi:hypothetical protein